MEAWFKKYPYKADEGDAIQMIHDCVEESKKAYKQGKDCYQGLAIAQSMLEDFFDEKGINPKIYL